MRNEIWQVREKEKYRRFYPVALDFFSDFLSTIKVSFPEEVTLNNFFTGLYSNILPFGVFGIPIIFIFSSFVRIGVYLIDKIPTKQ